MYRGIVSLSASDFVTQNSPRSAILEVESIKFRGEKKKENTQIAACMNSTEPCSCTKDVPFLAEDVPQLTTGYFLVKTELHSNPMQATESFCTVCKKKRKPLSMGTALPNLLFF